MVDASPEDLIKLLLKKIGKDGTLLMPAYGEKDDFFDIKNFLLLVG